jgi:hypothetical protein
MRSQASCVMSYAMPRLTVMGIVAGFLTLPKSFG